MRGLFNTRWFDIAPAKLPRAGVPVGGGGAGEVEAAPQAHAVYAGVARSKRSDARQRPHKQRGLPQHYWPVPFSAC